MKSRKQIIIAWAALLAGILLIAAAFAVPDILEKRMDNKNRKALKTVATKIFTCPNKELVDIFAGSSLTLEKDIRNYFEPYFTDNGLNKFIIGFTLGTKVYSTASGYRIKVDKVEISRSKEIKTNYSFKVHLSHGEEGSTMETAVIGGSAQFYEEQGKLSYIQFFDSELFNKLWWKETGVEK